MFFYTNLAFLFSVHAVNIPNRDETKREAAKVDIKKR